MRRIRPVEPGDTDAVTDAFIGGIAGMTYIPVLHTEQDNREFIRDVMLPNNEVWVADEDGRVVGFAGLGDDLLRHLWVHPDAQNRGAGAARAAAGEDEHDADRQDRLHLASVPAALRRG